MLYGDPLSSYANEVLDKLLSNEPELRDQLRVYTIKSNKVNAYSTNQGIIYVTVGLFGKVENEAQLAFVLAHEVSHFTNKHVLHSFENQKEIWSKGGDYRKLDVEERTLSQYKYSREAEFEADKDGLQYYLNAGYEPNEINSGFDVLLHGYLPIKQYKFDWSKLESDSFKISDYYLIDSVAVIKENDDIDDELLTHPNIQKRKRAIDKSLRKQDSITPGDLYLVKSISEFKELRALAWFEMINNYLRQANYVSCLYHVQFLQNEFPQHPFLLKAELMCWYGMQKLISNQQKSSYSSGYRKVEGELQAVYYFASKMPKRGINILATKFIWEHSSDWQSDSFVQDIKAQSLVHLAQTVKKDFFYTTYDKSKWFKPKRKRKPKKIDFLKTALIDLLSDSTFSAQFNQAYKDHDTENDESDEDYEEERLSDSYVAGVNSYYGLSNVNKLLYMSPKFYRVDLRKDIDERLLRSDQEQNDLQNRTEVLSAKAGIELVTLDEQAFENQSTETFNDFVLLRDWLKEEAQYSGSGFYSFSTQNLTELRKKYDTDYLGLSSVSHYTEKNYFNGGYFLLSVLTLYPIPFYLYWQLKPIHNLDYAFLVFDLKQGDIGFYDLKSFPSKYRKDVINSHLYNSFNQLNRK